LIMKPLSPKYPSIPFIILTIFLLGFLIYSNTLYYPFHFDDEPSITNNYFIWRLHNLKAIWNFCPTRFVTYLSFALNYYFHKLNVFGYHLVNILIHLTASIVAWWFVSLTFLTLQLKKEKLAEYSQLIAFFVALVFLTHPLQTQGVTYIVQRAASLAALLYIASLALYAKARLLQNTRQASHWRPYYFLSLSCAILGMFSKEITFTLPLMILLYEFFFLRIDKRIHWKQILPFFILLLSVFLWIYFGKLIDFKEVERIAKPPPWQSYLLTEFRVLLTYIRLLFLPINQNLVYDYPMSQSMWEASTLTSLGFLILIFLIGINLFSKYRLLSFSIFWFFLTLSVESSIIPIRDVIFEHRLYLPLFGFSLFLISSLFLILRDKSRPILIVTLIWTLIAAYSTLTYKRNFIWRDELTLWNDVVGKFSPKTEVLIESLKLPVVDYTKVIKINPNFTAAYLNQGRAYLNREEYGKGISALLKVLRVDPTHENAYYNLGIAHFAKGEYDVAILEFNKLLGINPNYVYGYNWRGNAYRDKGEYAKAISDYSQALKILPDFIEVYNNRAIAYRLQGEYDKAISDYSSILKLDPNYFFAYSNRAFVYFVKKDYDMAITDCNQAIKINPNDAQAYYNRAKAYLAKGEYKKAWVDVKKVHTLGSEVSLDFLKQLSKFSKE